MLTLTITQYSQIPPFCSFCLLLVSGSTGYRSIFALFVRAIFPLLKKLVLKLHSYLRKA